MSEPKDWVEAAKERGRGIKAGKGGMYHAALHDLPRALSLIEAADRLAACGARTIHRRESRTEMFTNFEGDPDMRTVMGGCVEDCPGCEHAAALAAYRTARGAK